MAALKMKSGGKFLPERESSEAAIEDKKPAFELRVSRNLSLC